MTARVLAWPRHSHLPLLGAALLGLALLYVMGLDQGWLLSLVQGNTAFDQNFIHELVHDSRHTAAFPCH